MLDTSGEVIGVVTSVIVEGFGLAIAANTVKLYLDQRLVDGEVITELGAAAPSPYALPEECYGLRVMPCRLGLSGHPLGNSESNEVTDINSGEIGRSAMSGE